MNAENETFEQMLDDSVLPIYTQEILSTKHTISWDPINDPIVAIDDGHYHTTVVGHIAKFGQDIINVEAECLYYCDNDVSYVEEVLVTMSRSWKTPYTDSYVKDYDSADQLLHKYSTKLTKSCKQHLKTILKSTGE